MKLFNFRNKEKNEEIETRENDNLDFKEAGNTSTEMQLNESKASINNSILNIFGVPTDWNWETFIKTAVMPILSAIECALNRDLLFEKVNCCIHYHTYDKIVQQLCGTHYLIEFLCLS